MDIIETLNNCLDALNSMTVTGRHNCTVVAGVSNDIDRILEVMKNDQGNESYAVHDAG